MSNKIDKLFESVGLEWQYILLSRSYPYRYKAGRSTTFANRLSNIRETMSREAGRPVHVCLFFKVPLFWAGASERCLHNCLAWWKATGMPGSGKTEWSWSLNFICMLFTWLACIWFDAPRGVSLVVLVLPLPFDFALLTLLLAVIQYGGVGLAIYGIWNIFF